MSDELSSLNLDKIVTRAQAGNRKSLELLYDLFFEKIYRFVGFKVSADQVDDLVSEIFLKMLSSLDKYHPQKMASFSAWFYRLARNHIIDFYRKKKEILGSDLEDENLFLELEDEDSLRPDQALLQKDELAQLKKIILDLPLHFQEILQLKFFDDLSNKEISEITDKSEGNIRIIQLRALKLLREKLGVEEL